MAKKSPRRAEDDEFQDLLSAQISKAVGLVTVLESRSFILLFEDGSGISMSLNPEDYSSQEAVTVTSDSYSLRL